MCGICPFGQEVVNAGIMKPVLSFCSSDATSVGSFDVSASVRGGGSLLGVD